jgi:hypothetical protein
LRPPFIMPPMEDLLRRRTGEVVKNDLVRAGGEGLAKDVAVHRDKNSLVRKFIIMRR